MQSMLFFNDPFISLLSKHPLYIQSLSFLNIGLNMENRNWGFGIGEIMNIGLLNSHLLSWDGILDKQICENDVSKIIQPIYLQNMKANPWFKQYTTIF